MDTNQHSEKLNKRSTMALMILNEAADPEIGLENAMMIYPEFIVKTLSDLEWNKRMCELGWIEPRPGDKSAIPAELSLFFYQITQHGREVLQRSEAL